MLSLERVVRNIIAQELMNTHTAFIGKIVRVNGERADVAPMHMYKQEGKEGKRYPLLREVPMLAKVKANELVLCMCCERDMSAALRGEVAVPAGRWRHSMSDAVVIGPIGANGGGGGVDILDCYPVGSVYTTVSASMKPAAVFGGTWERFGKGRTLMGVDENDPDFDAAGKTGGDKARLLNKDNLPEHTHGVGQQTVTSSDQNRSHTHTHGQPAHNHTGSVSGGAHTHGPPTNYAYWLRHSDGSSGAMVPTSGSSANYRFTATGAATASATPAMTVAINNSAATSTGGTTGNANQGHTHSVAIPAQDTQANATEKKAVSVIQPYITVYFWKRVA